MYRCFASRAWELCPHLSPLIFASGDLFQLLVCKYVYIFFVFAHFCFILPYYELVYYNKKIVLYVLSVFYKTVSFNIFKSRAQKVSGSYGLKIFDYFL